MSSILVNLRGNIPFILKGDSEGANFSIIDSEGLNSITIIIEDTGGYNLDYFETIYLPRITKDNLIEKSFRSKKLFRRNDRLESRKVIR